MQATIGGLAASASATGETVFGVLDVATGVLLIDMSATARPGQPEKRMEGCAVVTNNAGAEDCDQVFTEADLRAAIADYYAFAGRGLLVLEKPVQRLDPASKIEPDGLDEHGRKYRIAQDMSNGQIAVMVLCWFASRQAGFARQLDAFDDMMDLTVTSVGLPGSSVPRKISGYTMGGKLAVDSEGWPV
jgi:hypothetical protein